MQLDFLLAGNERLQRHVSDLVSVMSLLAMRGGREPCCIAGSPLDLVLGVPDLDFAHLQLNDASGDTPLNVTQLSQWANSASSAEGLRALLAPWLCANAQEWSPQLTVGGSGLAVLPVSLGLLGKIGLLVVGSRGADFPQQAESLLIGVAANRGMIGLQAAWRLRLRKQMHLARELDQRVEARTRELAKANEELQRRELEFQLVVGTIPAIVWSAHADGRADFVDRHFLRYVGLSAEEARDRGWIRAVHPGDLATFAGNWRAILASRRSGELQVRLRRHDGEYRCSFARGSARRRGRQYQKVWRLLQPAPLEAGAGRAAQHAGRTRP